MPDSCRVAIQHVGRRITSLGTVSSHNFPAVARERSGGPFADAQEAGLFVILEKDRTVSSHGGQNSCPGTPELVHQSSSSIIHRGTTHPNQETGDR